MRLLILSVAMLLAVAALALSASAQPFIGDYGLDQGTMRLFMTSFYADYIHKTTEGDTTGAVKGLVARTGEKLRMDNDMRGMAGAGDDPMEQTMLYTGTIMKPDSPLIMLYHVPEKYLLMEAGEAEGTPGTEVYERYQGQQAKPPVVEKVKVGEEKLEGHPCIIYDVTTTYPDGKVTKGRVWEATDYGDTRPYLKIEATLDGAMHVLTLHNVKLGTPAASWFEVPAGYVRIQSMMELFDLSALMGGG